MLTKSLQTFKWSSTDIQFQFNWHSLIECLLNCRWMSVELLLNVCWIGVEMNQPSNFRSKLTEKSILFSVYFRPYENFTIINPSGINGALDMFKDLFVIRFMNLRTIMILLAECLKRSKPCSGKNQILSTDYPLVFWLIFVW